MRGAIYWSAGSTQRSKILDLLRHLSLLTPVEALASAYPRPAHPASASQRRPWRWGGAKGPDGDHCSAPPPGPPVPPPRPAPRPAPPCPPPRSDSRPAPPAPHRTSTSVTPGRGSGPTGAALGRSRDPRACDPGAPRPADRSDGQLGSVASLPRDGPGPRVPSPLTVAPSTSSAPPAPAVRSPRVGPDRPPRRWREPARNPTRRARRGLASSPGAPSPPLPPLKVGAPRPPAAPPAARPRGPALFSPIRSGGGGGRACRSKVFVRASRDRL